MSDDEPTVQIPIPINSGVPYVNKADRADMMIQMKPEQVVEMIRMKLLGKEWVKNKWEDVGYLTGHSLTNLGAWKVTDQLLAIANTSTMTTKLADHEIKRRLRSVSKTLVVSMIKNWRSWGLKDVSMIGQVKEIVFSVGLVVMKQSEDATVLDFFGKTKSESAIYTDQNRKDSLRDKFKRGLGMQ
jgi:hypothetical protein